MTEFHKKLDKSVSYIKNMEFFQNFLLDRDNFSLDRFNEFWDYFFDEIQKEYAQVQNDSLKILSDLISGDPGEHEGMACQLSLLCGNIIEYNQADFRIPFKVIFNLIKRIMKNSQPILQEYHINNKIEEDILKSQWPEAYQSWNNLDIIWLPLKAILIRWKQMRKVLQNDGEFLSLLFPIAEYHEGCSWLIRLLGVWDNKEVLIIYPRLKKGYLLTVDGAANILQLHGLIYATIVGDQSNGLLPGKPAHPQAIKGFIDGPIKRYDDDQYVNTIKEMLHTITSDETQNIQSQFALFNWQLFEKDLFLNIDWEHFRMHYLDYHDLWKDYYLGDLSPLSAIQEYNNLSVILLIDVNRTSYLIPKRSFDDLYAGVELTKILSEREVENWLEKFKTGESDTESGKPDFQYKYAIELYNLGVQFGRDGKFEESIKLFQKAVNINPQNSNFLYNLAYSYEKQGNLKKAIENYKKCLENDHQYGNAWIGLGNVYTTKNNFIKAIECYQKVLEFNNKNADAYYNIANAYIHMNNKDNTLKNLQKAIALNPLLEHEVKSDQDFKEIWDDL